MPCHLKEINRTIQDHLKEGIVERVSDELHGEREFYVSHKAVITVIRETAESTKMRIVFDTSAKACQGSPSLIDHLETG